MPVSTARLVTVALAAALLAGTTLTAGATASTPASSSTLGPAQVWVTTADGSRTMALAGTVNPRTNARISGSVVTLHTTATGQSITGFGAAMTHSSAELLAGLSAAQRQQVLTDLFHPAGPVRLSVVRISLGASDFTPGAPFTYADTAGDRADWDLTSFSTARDEEQLRPVLRQIRAINPDVRIVASPWTAPAWLKESRSLYGGRLSTDPRAVDTYARYLTRALVEYRDAGVPVDLLTVQNEPQTRWFADYPRMEMPAATQVEVVGALGPHLRQAGLTTAVLAYDHNWAQHPADTSALAPGADPEHDYALRVLGSAVGGQVRGTAFHCYYGDASAQEQVRAAAPDKEIWVTECSGSHGATDGPAKIFHDTLLWQSRHLTTASLRHWATSVQTWNLALDPRGGPRSGGCETCTGVVTVDGTTVRPNAEYYVLGHAARFLPRGSVRVMSATSGPAVDHVAFTTPSGEVVVLANNPGSRSTTLTVVVGRQSWQVSLPARSTATVHVARG